MNPEEQNFTDALDGRAIAIDAGGEPYRIRVLSVHLRQRPDHHADITGQFLGPQVREFVLKSVDSADLIPERIDAFIARLVNRTNTEEAGRIEIDLDKGASEGS